MIPSLPPSISVVAVRSKEENEPSPTSLYAMKLCHRLRIAGISVIYSYDGNTSKQMKKGSKEAVGAIIVGEDEIARGTLGLKNFHTGEQREISKEQLEQECLKLIQLTNKDS